MITVKSPAFARPPPPPPQRLNIDRCIICNYLKLLAAAALWESELILINQLKLTGLQKNRDAAANFGCSWNFNRVKGYQGD